MIERSDDQQFLQQALDLARQGLGLSSPNPHVGALIVDTNGSIVGEGCYTYDGVKHAEILALEQAGGKARGGTLYINLEPHCHQGRTPPCTDALIAAGIQRVVASMPDPNPQVSGRGFEKLRAAGVHIEVGQLEEEARLLNGAFARYVRHGIPLVTLKAAMTLDGKIAPPPSRLETQVPGIPRGGWITGELARAHVQQQRHQSDAVLVGVGTILADDPLLTDRSGNPRRRELLRVILDSHLRLPLQSAIVQSVADGNCQRTVMVFCSAVDAHKETELEARGIRVECLSPGADGRPDIHAVLGRLGQLQITSVMIEGGSTVNGMMLAGGIVDKLFLYYAPKIMGDAGTVPFIADAAFGRSNAIRQVKQVQLHRFGEDFAVEGYLRDPYGE